MIQMKMPAYDKLLFYSVISSYLAACILGLIKKTRTVAESDVLPGWEKLTDVLCVDFGLFGEDF